MSNRNVSLVLSSAAFSRRANLECPIPPFGWVSSRKHTRVISRER
jgi:hypothetical protein